MRRGAGNVVISSAVGNGVGDDKLVYTYVPQIIDYYLGEKPLLQNVDTFRCLVGRGVRASPSTASPNWSSSRWKGSGGYGIVFGPDASPKELAAITRKIKADPRGWIAQPLVQLSTVPTKIDDVLSPRHVGLCGPLPSTTVRTCGCCRRPDPGGTSGRFAGGQLQQGGGSKDTWVLASRTSDEDPELSGEELGVRAPGIRGAGAGSRTEHLASNNSSSNSEHLGSAQLPRTISERSVVTDACSQRRVPLLGSAATSSAPTTLLGSSDVAVPSIARRRHRRPGPHVASAPACPRHPRRRRASSTCARSPIWLRSAATRLVRSSTRWQVLVRMLAGRVRSRRVRCGSA